VSWPAAAAASISAAAGEGEAAASSGADHRRRPHCLLNGERACNGVDSAVELDDETVAHPAHQLPFAVLYSRIDDVAPDRRKGGMGAIFIRSHQPRIADNVGAQDDGNSVFDVRYAHRRASSRLSVPDQILL